jgi:hypothetical protein
LVRRDQKGVYVRIAILLRLAGKALLTPPPIEIPAFGVNVPTECGRNRIAMTAIIRFISHGDETLSIVHAEKFHRPEPHQDLRDNFFFWRQDAPEPSGGW